MPQGLIVKALSGYYYVLPEENSTASDNLEPNVTIQCRARGVFKKREITPLVGDKVIYEETENGEGYVMEVLPRFSELIRPPIANIELVVLVFSSTEPALNLQLLDKFIVHAENSGLDAIICMTKFDLLADHDSIIVEKESLTLAQVTAMYEKIGYPIILTSSKKGIGVSEILSRLQNKISVFAGQSGVGKSSLLNAMEPGLTLQTNQISQKLGRGKHTTRHVELIQLKNGAVVADTPGFSQLDFLELEVEALGECFREFSAYAENCKFRGCSHNHEPGCKVIEAVDAGEIARTRYDNYISFLTEMKEQRERNRRY